MDRPKDSYTSSSGTAGVSARPSLPPVSCTAPQQVDKSCAMAPISGQLAIEDGLACPSPVEEKTEQALEPEDDVANRLRVALEKRKAPLLQASAKGAPKKQVGKAKAKAKAKAKPALVGGKKQKGVTKAVQKSQETKKPSKKPSKRGIQDKDSLKMTKECVYSRAYHQTKSTLKKYFEQST